MASQVLEKLTAKFRTGAGSSMELDVLDLSEGGIMVNRKSWGVQSSERVLVTLPGLASQPGTVVWVEDDQAGVAFEQPLHEAVLTHLKQAVPA